VATDEDLRRYRDNRQDEIDGSVLYRALAHIEDQSELKQVYLRLAETEERHASFWEARLRDAGVPTTPRRPSWRARVLRWFGRRLGPRFLLSTLASEEQAGQTMYDDQTETHGTTLPADERSHARLLRQIAGDTTRGVTGSLVARLEGRHRAIGGNALRAAVLGANDGLVSNLALVMGVAGAALGEQVILITGLAGLLAGAASMALGEWVSVQSSRELYEKQIAVEAEEIAEIPEEEEEELALIYQAKGLPEGQARQLAARIMADEETALDTMAREELGIDPQELGGSPWTAAGASFLLFAAGAVIPVISFMFLEGMTAVWTSLGFASGGLFLIGTGIALITGRRVVFSGSRQMVLGLAAAGITFGIGRLLGVAVTG
jgi:VIT1/CCC1 family predicted Fe2+/Mn2+ transporter